MKRSLVALCTAAFLHASTAGQDAIPPTKLIGYWVQGPGQVWGIRLNLFRDGRFSAMHDTDLNDFKARYHGSWKLTGSQLVLTEDGKKLPTFLLDVVRRGTSFILVKIYDREAHRKDPSNTYYFFEHVSAATRNI